MNPCAWNARKPLAILDADPLRAALGVSGLRHRS